MRMSMSQEVRATAVRKSKQRLSHNICSIVRVRGREVDFAQKVCYSRRKAVPIDDVIAQRGRHLPRLR